MVVTGHALPALAADVTAGVLCPNCGCRRLLSERVSHTDTHTDRFRVCAECGHRVRTAERLDRPAAGPVVCPACGCRRLLAANSHHRLDRLIRYRRCPCCRHRVRTAETMVDAHPPQQPARRRFDRTPRHSALAPPTTA